MKKQYIILFISLISLVLQAKGNPDYYFKTLDIRNGLSQNSVFAILQDKQGFMWFGTKEGLNRFDGLKFRIFKRENSSLGNDYITALCEDSDGNIWIGTDAGIYIYDPRAERFAAFNQVTQEGESILHAVSQILADENGNIWISVDYQGLFFYNHSQKTLHNHLKRGTRENPTPNVNHFWLDGTVGWVGLYNDNLYFSDNQFETLMPFIDADGKEIFRNDVVTSQIARSHNRYYVGSAKGLTEINLTTKKTRRLLNTYVRELQFNSDQELWVGTETGLYIYYPDKEKFTHLSSSSTGDPYAVTDNAIYAISQDYEGGMWIGSYFGGINYYPYPHTYFEKFYPERIQGFGKRVREFCESNNGTLWIGTEDKGLFNYNPEDKSITPFTHPSISHNIHGLCLDGNYLWVGTFSGGLNRINLNTHAVKHYRYSSSSGSLSSNDVMSICKTSSGELFIGTIQGLQRYNYNSDDFTIVPQLGNNNINHIFEDSDGNLWISTYANGIFFYDIKQNKWKNYSHNKDDSSSLSSDKVLSVYEDSKKRIWIMTQGGGLCQYLSHSDNFISHGMSNNLPSNTVYRMVEDSKKNLWLTTNNGLVCLDIDLNFNRVYTTEDGLLSNQFNYQSSHKDKKGQIYFGNIEGFVSFNPLNFTESNVHPPIVITDLYLSNKLVSPGSANSPLKQSVIFSDMITLRHDQKFLSFHVANLGYQSPASSRLVYSLEGFNNKWNPVEDNYIINFSHLPYGSYVLRVKNISGESGERTLKIRVNPPLYLSVWAYAFYIMSGIVLTILALLFYRKKYDQKQKGLITEIEQKKERDLYNSKIEFFTNVTHEIRTPLTLIKAPLESILNHKDISDEIRNDLDIMDRNTNRLLDLANQLLDFQKAEKQGFRLKFSECNISTILQDIYQQFTSLALQKGLDYKIRKIEDIQASADWEALIKILSNLFTNAIKYSENYVHISLWKEGSMFKLSIWNDGENIPAEMADEIFKPFTQYKNTHTQYVTGTGIGLTLARTLAELHDGSLAFDNSSGENCFTLTMPITHMHSTLPVVNEESVEEPEEDNLDMPKDKNNQTILIIEDNLEMLSFIKQQLSFSYEILTATNGMEALNVLNEYIVNLIISDIMMPELDGLELCKRIRSDLNYSHIPIILLTAKVSLQSKMDGLQSGADAYIEKPFSVELLKTSIVNLLSNREKLRLAFTHSPFVHVNSMGVTEAEQDFLKSLKQIIEEHMHDPQFNIDKMSDLLNMSRASLHRKIKGALDMTPNDYIRLERLKKAVHLLESGKYRINEVCYMVGFNTPSYFAKCFQKQFKVLPKDFIEVTTEKNTKHKEDNN